MIYNVLNFYLFQAPQPHWQALTVPFPETASARNFVEDASVSILPDSLVPQPTPVLAIVPYPVSPPPEFAPLSPLPVSPPDVTLPEVCIAYYI